MLHTKIRLIWLINFRGEDFLEINQSETRMACGGHVSMEGPQQICSSETA
jgi:hypothetical protein